MKIDLLGKDILLQEAIDSANPGDVIILDNKTYYEKIEVKIKNLTIEGRESSCVAFDATNQSIIPIMMGGDGVKKFGTTGSSTFRVLEGADGFKCRNVKFLNYFKRSEGDQGQAVAFKSEISDLYMENCKFISQQDTLYIDFGANNKIVNCYIEGDVDFIFGSADCLFEGCEIKAINVVGRAYFTAPDTYEYNNIGFVFNNCKFISSEGVHSKLGRAWYPKGARVKVYPKLTIKNSEFIGDIDPNLVQMHEGDPDLHTLVLNNCILNGVIINK